MGKYKKHKIAFILISVLFAIIAFFAVSEYPSKSEGYIISYTEEEYANAVKETCPEINVINSNRSSTLRDFVIGCSTALYDTQAEFLSHPDYRFEPHITQTIVIAIDRSVTDEEINSFTDLLNSNLPIGFDFGEAVAENMWDYSRTHQIALSMSKALFGEYDLDKTAAVLKELDEENRFFVHNLAMPVMVTYDSTAVNLMKNGRDLEIIIPSDGTLSFKYGAFLYKNCMSFSDNLSEELVLNGYRLIDGTADENYYPTAESYENATYVEDIEEYNYATSKVSKTIRREGFDTRRFGFTNTKELNTFYLILVFALILYLVFMIHRLTDKKIRNAIVAIMLLLILFVTAGLLKSLNASNDTIETALWYSYYIPILLTPAMFVYIAINTGNTRLSPSVLKYYKVYFAIVCMAILLVFTNNYHRLVFIVYNHSITSFSYNYGYYFIMGLVLFSIIFSYALLTYKSIASPKKLGFIYPFLTTLLVIAYAVAYATDFMYVREFDLTFAATIIIVLYTEACMQSRLFPSNIGYKKLFMHSGLAMEIKDKNKKTAYKSLVTKDVNENYLLRHSEIAGGSFSYFEDYTSLNIAEQKLEEINDEIRSNNEFLLQKGQINAALAALAAERAVYDNIDNILYDGTERIEDLIEKIKQGGDKKRYMNIISLNACMMKRECMLRINALYQDKQLVSIIMNSLHELKEYAESIDLNITLNTSVKDELKTSDTAFIYRFFSLAVQKAAELDVTNIIVQIYEEDSDIVFSVIVDKVLFSEEELIKANENTARYTLTSKRWETGESYLLSFSNAENREVQNV